MSIVQGALLSFDARHPWLTHVEGLLVGSSQAVSQALSVLQEEISSLLLIEVVRANRAGGESIQGGLGVHIIDVVLLRSQSFLSERIETVGCIGLRVRMSRVCHDEALWVLTLVHHHVGWGTNTASVVVQVHAYLVVISGFLNYL